MKCNWKVFKRSIASYVYPNIFKNVQVTPIIIRKVRSVSVLINLSKVFKTLYAIAYKISVKHSTFLLKINLVSVKKRDSEIAALSLLDKLLPTLEEKNFMCIFLSYSAFFSILFDKLEM